MNSVVICVCACTNMQTSTHTHTTVHNHMDRTHVRTAIWVPFISLCVLGVNTCIRSPSFYLNGKRIDKEK